MGSVARLARMLVPGIAAGVVPFEVSDLSEAEAGEVVALIEGVVADRPQEVQALDLARVARESLSRWRRARMESSV